MIFHRSKWVSTALGVALTLGILPSPAKGDDSIGCIENGKATQVGSLPPEWPMSKESGRAQLNIHGTIPLDGHSIGDGDKCALTVEHFLFNPDLGELVWTHNGVGCNGLCEVASDSACIAPDFFDTICPKDSDSPFPCPLPTPPCTRKSACKGDNNDVTCKDDRRPSLKIKFDQKSDLVFDLKVDRAVIPKSKAEIFDEDPCASLSTVFHLNCPGGTFWLNVSSLWCDSGDSNIRTSAECK